MCSSLLHSLFQQMKTIKDGRIRIINLHPPRQSHHLIHKTTLSKLSFRYSYRLLLNPIRCHLSFSDKTTLSLQGKRLQACNECLLCPSSLQSCLELDRVRRLHYHSLSRTLVILLQPIDLLNQDCPRNAYEHALHLCHDSSVRILSEFQPHLPLSSPIHSI